MFVARSCRVQSSTSHHRTIVPSVVARRNAVSVPKLEDINARIALEEKILKSKSVPEQIVFRVNMKFFKSLPEEWHGSHLQSYTSALASLEGALKGKFADLAKNAKDSQTGLIYAYALLNAVYESNPSGEIKERGQAFQKVLDTYAAGPKDSVAAKVQEADKLLKAKKDKLVKGILNAYTEHPLVGSSYTPDEFKYINTTVEKYAQGYVDVWGTEVKLTLEGA